MKTIGLIGNPNCGKTTIFNGLTGSNQHIGNWPGVTVEKKEGVFELNGERAKLVDLPGVYSLTAASEDERASLEYVLSHEADVYVNVVDATTLERNLYLTLLMCELEVPMVVAVTMMDIARQRRTVVDLEHLSKHLGVPVVGVNANDARDVEKLRARISEALAAPKVPKVPVEFPNELEQEIDILASASVKTAEAFKVSRRWVAMKAIEGDPFIRQALVDCHDMAPEVIDGAVARCTDVLGDPPDVVLADTRYGVIAGLVRDVVRVTQNKVYLTEKIDKVVINRFLGIPIFLGVMAIAFWITQTVGGALVEVVDKAGDALFVAGSARLLAWAHSPDWLVAILSSGAGTALKTVATFLPPVGFMFLFLAMLEDSGYMARAAFVMDRFMRWIGLPGKSFVPMLVGFGCTVPAIMATRTLESRRDRLLTVFMAPFMSCGAKLPIWVLFAAAFFPRCQGRFVFAIYLSGVVLGIATGLLLKHTLFQGEPTHFIMELPPYHVPRPKHILLHTWERLRMFVWRAGKFIVPMVLVLGTLNTIGVDGSVGHADTENSVLSVAGRAITPVFEPIGVERDNWPAAVAVFTGLFAKESVIGTMKGLYGQEAARENPDAPVDDAAALRRHFPKGERQMFAYLLFILLYVPCLAATGVVFHEIGTFYGTVFVVYLTLLGWSVATAYHAVAVSGSFLWGGVGCAILAGMFGVFRLWGRKHRVDLP
ncbi:MAG: ferrous iron transport protein B [Kiritimatiellae bacterium]|nr:ferrous iron transport protein B [Kiritimatiellia bacterium]